MTANETSISVAGMQKAKARCKWELMKDQEQEAYKF
jgi:hypothetical protein